MADSNKVQLYAEAAVFPCAKGALRRHPQETNGQDYRLTTEAPSACSLAGESMSESSMRKSSTSGSRNGSNGRCC